MEGCIYDYIIEYLENAKSAGIRYIPSLKPDLQGPVQISLRDKLKALKDLKNDFVDKCSKCSLHSARKNTVFGEGNHDAVLMFIGEAPGEDEDKLGRPFVGKAGRLLTKIIEAIDLRREDVYIANILKCRPPFNRDPDEKEMKMCMDYLQKQIEIIKPSIICALGRMAAQALLKTESSISKIRGRFHTVNGIKIMPTFHPSYLLRNPSQKRPVWEDMKMIRKEHSQIVRGRKAKV